MKNLLDRLRLEAESHNEEWGDTIPNIYSETLAEIEQLRACLLKMYQSDGESSEAFAEAQNLLWPEGEPSEGLNLTPAKSDMFWCAKHGPHLLGVCPQCDELAEARSIVATAVMTPEKSSEQPLWICRICGHEWRAVETPTCPKCSCIESSVRTRASHE